MKDIIIVPKLHSTNIYYIFRENGQELTINMSGHYPKSSHKLTAKELNFINVNII